MRICACRLLLARTRGEVILLFRSRVLVFADGCRACPAATNARRCEQRAHRVNGPCRKRRVARHHVCTSCSVLHIARIVNTPQDPCAKLVGAQRTFAERRSLPSRSDEQM
jgi:hypothetical protein